MAGGSILYLKRREKTLKKKGEGFVTSEKDAEATANMLENPPNIILSLLPLIAVIVTLNFLNFDIIVALLTGIILILILSLNKIKGFVKAINIGANNSVTAMINTRSEERRVGKECRCRR